MMDYNKIVEEGFEFHKNENPFLKPDEVKQAEWDANIKQHKKDYINMLYQKMEGQMQSVQDMMESDESIDSADRMKSILDVKDWFINSTFAKYKREFLEE